MISSLNFDQIEPHNMELSALECLKNTPIDLNSGKCCFHLFLVVFNLILLILSGNKMH